MHQLFQFDIHTYIGFAMPDPIPQILLDIGEFRFNNNQNSITKQLINN